MSVVPVNNEVVKTTLDNFEEFLKDKLSKKGNLSFNSRLEIYGKLAEEQYECLKEVHKKDDTKLANELFDVAVVALFGVMSLKANEENKKK